MGSSRRLNAEVTPEEELVDFGKQLPGVWGHVERERLKAGTASEGWPKWCYLPYERALAVIGRHGPFHVPSHMPAGDLTRKEQDAAMRPMLALRLCMLAAWRHTRGVYRFDPDLYEKLVETPLDREIPCERLLRLPEWCVTMATPGLMMRDTPKSHVMLTVTLRDSRPVILMGSNLLAPITVPLVRQSVLDVLEQARLSGDVKEAYAPFVRSALALALYLCTEEPGIERDQRRPARVKLRTSWKPGPPSQVQPWLVGERMGSALRRAREEWAAAEADADEGPDGEADEGKRRARPRPHFRAAHFRTVWLGPRDNPHSDFRWIPPTLVNARTPEALIKTVRPVPGDGSQSPS